MNNFSNIIAKALHIGEPYVLNTLALIDEGATIPFMSRYRKEKTGGMDEVQIGQIDELYSRLKELAKRKETIGRTITEAGAMTPELQRTHRTTAGTPPCWKTYIYPIDPSGAQGHR